MYNVNNLTPKALIKYIFNGASIKAIVIVVFKAPNYNTYRYFPLSKNEIEYLVMRNIEKIYIDIKP